jgi:hypothetical protein
LEAWRAKPLDSYRLTIGLISATTTKTGSTVCCKLDPARYPNGIVVSDPGDRAHQPSLPV